MKTHAREYPPGFFTQPVYRRSKACPAGFPPRFEPTPTVVDLRAGVHASARSSQAREEAFSKGTGWGKGTLDVLKGSGFDRPAWMGQGK